MKHKVLLTLLTAMLSLAATAKDIKTIVLTTMPQMHCENCENKIKNNVRFVKGVKSIETNVEKQTVTIKYDADKTTPKAIVEGFAKIGYDAKEVTETTSESTATDSTETQDSPAESSKE